MKRPVEFTISLDAFEQKLSAELTKAEDKKLQLEQELSRVQSALLATNEEHANAKTAIHRFDIFIQRFSKSDLRYCPKCYVLHEELSPLAEVGQNDNEFTKQRCGCGYEVSCSVMRAIAQEEGL